MVGLKIGPDAVDHCRGGQGPGRFHHRPLAMAPVWFHGMQPGAFHRQAAREETHAPVALAPLLVHANPGAHFAAHGPGGVIPDQHHDLCLLNREPLTAPAAQGGRDLADWTPLDKPQPDLLYSGTQHPLATPRFRSGVALDRHALQQRPRLPGWPGRQRRLGQATPPRLIDNPQHPIRMLGGPVPQAVAPLFFRASWGSGLVIQRLARCQRTPRRVSA